MQRVFPDRLICVINFPELHVDFNPYPDSIPVVSSTFRPPWASATNEPVSWSLLSVAALSYLKFSLWSDAVNGRFCWLSQWPVKGGTELVILL